MKKFNIVLEDSEKNTALEKARKEIASDTSFSWLVRWLLKRYLNGDIKPAKV